MICGPGDDGQRGVLAISPVGIGGIATLQIIVMLSATLVLSEVQVSGIQVQAFQVRLGACRSAGDMASDLPQFRRAAM